MLEETCDFEKPRDEKVPAIEPEPGELESRESDIAASEIAGCPVSVMRGTLADALVFRSLLQASGYHPSLVGEYTACLLSWANPFTFGVQVAVPESEIVDVLPLVLHSGLLHGRMLPSEVAQMVWSEVPEQAQVDLHEALKKSPLAVRYGESAARREHRTAMSLSIGAFLLYVPLLLGIFGGAATIANLLMPVDSGASENRAGTAPRLRNYEVYGFGEALLPIGAGLVSLVVSLILFPLTIRFRSRFRMSQERYLAMAQPSAEQVLDIAGEHDLPYAILLRNFDHFAHTNDLNRLPRIHPIEHVLLDAACRARNLPIVCLNDPRQMEPIPGIFRFASTQQWRELVRSTMSRAALVVFFVSEISPAIQIELDIVSSVFAQERTIIFIDEKLALGGTAEGTQIKNLLEPFGRVVFAMRLVDGVPMTSITPVNLQMLFSDPRAAEDEPYDYRKRFQQTAIAYLPFAIKQLLGGLLTVLIPESAIIGVPLLVLGIAYLRAIYRGATRPV